LSQLVEAWQMSQEVNDFLLRHIPHQALKARSAPRTRNVAAQFAHMHNVRLRWLRHAAPASISGLRAFPRGAEPSPAALRSALRQSSRAMQHYLEACEATGKVKSWNGPPATFLSYMVAHEAHHRGLVMATFRLCGVKLPDAVVYGIWQWGMRRDLRGEGQR